MTMIRSSFAPVFALVVTGAACASGGGPMDSGAGDGDVPSGGDDDGSTGDESTGTDETAGECGDGSINANEDCEPGAGAGGKDDLGGVTCSDLGWDQGVLTCTSACRFDDQGCSSCGDDMRTGDEACDGDDFGDATCEDFESAGGESFDGGELACTASCTIDTAGCMACGDAAITGSEVCDGDVLGDQTCESLGHSAGELACATDCLAFDESGCTTCGNDQAENGEDCDGDDLGGTTCVDLGFAGGGDLDCTDLCGFDTSGCSDNTCGDGVLQGNDVCDCGDAGSPCTSAQLGGNTCEDLDTPSGDQKYDGGDLACQSPSNCTAFDVSGCFYCGDDQVDTGEACDGDDLDGQSCVSLGHSGGTLACNAVCEFDESDCEDLENPYRQCYSSATSLVDGGTLTTSFNVSPSVQMSDVNVTLDLAHAYVGDLVITLRHGSDSVRMVDRPGDPAVEYGCTGQDIDATLDDESTNPVENECELTMPTIAGTFRPNTSLSALDGDNSAGSWSLDIQDVVQPDGGVLYEWCVEIRW